MMAGRDHPLLEKVRQCSSTPDLAVDFFTKILSPCHECRLRADALRHPYLAPVIELMTKDLATAQPPREGERMHCCVILLQCHLSLSSLHFPG